MTASFETLVDVLRHRSLVDGDRTAYIYLRDGQNEDIRWTYRELEQKVAALSQHILRHAKPGERVLICHHPGMDYVLSFWACVVSGIIAVPVYPPRFNQKLERIQSIVQDVGAKIALTSTSVVENIRPLLTTQPSLAQIVWVETDTFTLSSDSPVTERPRVNAGDLAFIQYTSGSTSQPKGVMLTHSNLVSNLAAIQNGFGHHSESRGVTWLPPYHDMGLIGGVLSPVFTGFPVVMFSPFTFLQRPIRWLQAISKYKSTSSGAPNFAFELCAKRISDEQVAELDLSHWETAFCGAEPIRAEAMDTFAKKFAPAGFRSEAFYPCYGLAEATLMVSGGNRMTGLKRISLNTKHLENERRATVVDANAPGSRQYIGCGHAVFGHEIRIVNADGMALSDGQVGEIWVHGPSIAKGYWNRPDESKRTFQAEVVGESGKHFLRTGDLGFLNCGELFVTGRVKDLVIIRGRNVYPQDIESTVQAAHAGVASGNGAVFSVEAAGEERLVVVQEIDRKYRAGLETQEAESVLKTIYEKILESHELKPHAVMLVKHNSIPLTSSGKIQRQATRKLFLDGGLEIVSRYQEGVQGI